MGYLSDALWDSLDGSMLRILFLTHWGLGDAYLCFSEPSHLMACHLFGGKILPELVLSCYQGMNFSGIRIMIEKNVYPENAFGIVKCKMLGILSRRQGVKSVWLDWIIIPNLCYNNYCPAKLNEWLQMQHWLQTQWSIVVHYNQCI